MAIRLHEMSSHRGQGAQRACSAEAEGGGVCTVPYHSLISMDVAHRVRRACNTTGPGPTDMTRLT
jgi:hypothetical protein